METLKITVFPIGKLMANCCVAYSDDGTAVVVDPGGDPAPVTDFIRDNGLRCAAILLTHGHDDHTEGVLSLRESTGAPVYIGDSDGYRLKEPADFFLHGGEMLRFGDIAVEVIPAPGHTEGSLCFLSDGILFAGDTLFRGSVGRTDLPGGSSEKLGQTLEALKERFGGSDITVVPGHGEITDFRYEMEHNYFL